MVRRSVRPEIRDTWTWLLTIAQRLWINQGRRRGARDAAYDLDTSLVKDVLPKIEAPFVLFLGEVTAAQLNEDSGPSIPVVGFSVRMRDPSVAADLDLMIINLIRVLNFAWAGAQEHLVKIERRGS